MTKPILSTWNLDFSGPDSRRYNIRREMYKRSRDFGPRGKGNKAWKRVLPHIDCGATVVTL